MKTVLIVACSLLFLSAAAFADAPVPLPDEALAAILGEPLAGASCAAQVASMNRASVVQNEKTCTVTVTCLDGTTRSCSTATGSCTAVNPNCPTAAGSVNCNGVVSSCPSCCAELTFICCQCLQTRDCDTCCRCAGKTPTECRRECF